MRHIVLDTETTGFHAEGDDRIVEIGALEIINFVPTGRVFHHYLNPERPIPPDATRVHGITDDMVAAKPIFASVADELETFIGDSQLVIHNAEFDMRFLNAERKRLGLATWPMSMAIDTLAIARRLFPGAPNSLDALCKRFGVDLSDRTFHGALLDARLLADVFLELSGGRQPELLGATNKRPNLLERTVQQATSADDPIQATPTRPLRVFAASPEELATHANMVAELGDAAIWPTA